MKTITLLVPDTFTEAQVAFIKQSAMNQIETEIRKEAVVPKATLDAVEAKVTALKVAQAATEAQPK